MVAYPQCSDLLRIIGFIAVLSENFMALDRIFISNFRNHRQSELSGTKKLNLLIGENGAGKTNILEAISLMSPGRGLRRASLSDLPYQDQKKGFQIGASLVEQNSESARLGTFIDDKQPGRRFVRINGAAVRAQLLSEWLAISWLTPAMDGLFTDTAGARRRYMDRLALALYPEQAQHVSSYERTIRERNKLLEENRDKSWLDAIELQAANHGNAVAANRSKLIEQLNGELGSFSEGTFATPVLSYQPGGPATKDELLIKLQNSRSKDRAAGRCLVGPHKDDLAVIMSSNGQKASVCSTGEQKAMLISLTLAHSEMAAEGRPNVLLLDEIVAHLDPIRRTALFNRLENGRAQVWMTGTDKISFNNILEKAKIWRVNAGSVETL